MADGDIVYGQPNGYYRKAYEAICEGRSDSTRLLIDSLLKHIKHIGDVPVILAKRIGEYLAKEIEKGERNWHNLSQGLDKLKNQYLVVAPHYNLELVHRAGKIVLNEFRYGDRTETNNLSEVLVGQFIKELFQSRFEAKIDLTSHHHNGINSEVLISVVQDIKPKIYDVIDTKRAKKATADESVSKLRMPKRQNIQPIDMDEDFLSQEFLELDDIVDRTYEFEKLSIDDMQNRLIQLYETYVSEWKRAESILEKGFLNPTLAVKKN